MAKPILFNTEMVKAILEGRKTSTRRITKLRPYTSLNETNGDFEICESETQNFFRCLDDFIEWAIAKCRYQVRDILYVRETWRKQTIDKVGHVEIQYKADFSKEELDCYGRRGGYTPCKWKPSIHMPKSMARIFLKVTDIKVQRLQDITEDEAQQEGIDPEVAIEYSNWRPTFYDPDSVGEPNYREAFKDLWDKLYKKKGYGWDNNPWVFVISFKRVEKEG